MFMGQRHQAFNASFIYIFIYIAIVLGRPWVEPICLGALVVRVCDCMYMREVHGIVWLSPSWCVYAIACTCVRCTVLCMTVAVLAQASADAAFSAGGRVLL